MRKTVQRPPKTRKIQLRTNDDFIKAVNDGFITLEHWDDRYVEGFIEGSGDAKEYVQYALYTAALLAGRKLYSLDDKGIYSLFEAMKYEVDTNLDTREKIGDRWDEMRETLNRVANDIPDPDMKKDRKPDGKFYYEE